MSSCGQGHFQYDEFAPQVRAHPGEADEYFNLGTAYSILEREEEAVKAFGEAIRLNPGDAGSYYGLGYALMTLGRDAEAAGAYGKALGLAPPKGQHFKAGTAYFMAGQFEAAAKELELAIEGHDPHPVTSGFRLGLAYTNLGRFKEGIGAFERTLAMNGEVAANVYNIFFYMGLNYQAIGDSDRALAAYRESVRRIPSFPYVHLNLGVVYFDKGAIDAARAEYDTLLRLDPDLAQKLDDYMKTNAGKGARR